MTEELKGKLDAVGFKIVEEIDVGDLSTIKEERPLLPPSANVLLEIKQVKIGMSGDEKYRWLSIRFSLVDGVEVAGAMKFKNMSVWSDNICYYADPEKYTKEHFVKRQHLLGLSALLKATDLVGSKVNDELTENLFGKKVVGMIKQYQNSFTAKDGTEVNRTENSVPSRSLKAVSMESQV